jgi:archaellum component FlaF (FlaF/FlaG flagellin family)
MVRAFCIVPIASCLLSPAFAQTTALVSVSPGGVPGNGVSGQTTVSISADGRYVAFDSSSSNLVPFDANGPFQDIFVRDLSTGTTTVVSVDSNGVQATSYSFNSWISADGRYVAFGSAASNLVPGDTNGVWDIFVHDMVSGTTVRVSVDSNGVQSDANSQDLQISADGRYVAFDSVATNLVAGDTNFAADVFVHDMVTGTTVLASVDSNGVQGNDASNRPAISADGRYVAFTSVANSLVPGDTNGLADVFVHDMVTGSTRRASVDSAGNQGNGQCEITHPGAISANGRYVAFSSAASNLVPGDTNGSRDAFVHDMVSGATTRVSVDSNGAQANASTYFVALSSDGRYAGMWSYATNLVPGDTNGQIDDFVHDMLNGATERVSVDSNGAQGNGQSGGSRPPAISADGRFVVFSSKASNLVPGDTNGFSDVFVRDRGAAASFTPFCYGDGTAVACPCGNTGVANRGCQNSASTGGAALTGAGVASLANDSVQLTSSSELPSALSIVLQGSTFIAPVNFGDGLRCAGGSLKRLYTKNASSGSITVPVGAEPSISVRSATLGDTIPLGVTRIYQVYYRDPNLGFCPGGFNATHAVAIAWGA